MRRCCYPTYGVLVYQEQVLDVANAVAGFTLAEGDLLRRAMTKDRGPGAMQELRREFLRRAWENGVPAAKAEEVFSWMEGFSVYGFSAAHAASFAELSYASAYMRRHYPAEFFCALLDSQPMGFYSPQVAPERGAQDRARGAPAGHPPLGKGLHRRRERHGAARGPPLLQGALGEVYLVHRLREARRPFASVADLYQRTAVEKDSLENLVRGGFLDSLAGGAEPVAAARRDEDCCRRSVGAAGSRRCRCHTRRAGGRRERRSVEHLPLAETAKERMEWEVLGLNVHSHPLSPYRDALEELGVVPSEEIREFPHGTRARAAGLIECLQSPPTKSGHRIYFLLIEDEWGLLQATIFRSVYERCGDVLHHEGAFLIEGRVEQTIEKGFAFLVHRIESLRDILLDARVPVPRVASSPGAFLRAGRRSRKAG